MIELNKEALDVVFAEREQCDVSIKKSIETYLSALPKPAPKTRQIPFDASKVKPGDKVLCAEMLLTYLCQGPNGDVITERDGPGLLLQRWPSAFVTIPTPVETVKVGLVRGRDGGLMPVLEDSVTGDYWTQVSDWVEVEVTK